MKGGEVDAGVGGEAAAAVVVSGAEALERTRTSLLSSSLLVLFVLSRAARPSLVSTPDTLRAHVVSYPTVIFSLPHTHTSCSHPNRLSDLKPPNPARASHPVYCTIQSNPTTLLPEHVNHSFIWPLPVFESPFLSFFLVNSL